MAVPASSVETARILLVSRESSLSHSLQTLVGDQLWRIEQAFSGLEALERMETADSADVVLLDVRPGDADALHTLRWLRKVSPQVPIVLLSNDRHTREAQEALQLGARQCLSTPILQREFEAVMKQQLEKSPDRGNGKSAAERIDFIGDDCSFVSASPGMHKIRMQAEVLAKLDVPVLIRGESGTGKEVVARLIHKLSNRPDGKFVEIDCGAFPADTLESELFGYERGVNGAARSKPGKLELCHEGTIFLDEIEQLPASAQGKLLQLLQQKQFYRLGGKMPIKTDVRILAASNGGIDRALAERKLREDLYYSLSAFTLHIPALRQRADEIPALLDHFMHRMAKQYDLAPQSFSPQLVESCQQYAWPGNLRELENFVKRYLVIGDDSLTYDEAVVNLDSSSYVVAALPSDKEREKVTAIDAGSLKALMRNIKGEAERNAIAGALEKTNWNRRAAARHLSISYRGLLYKIQQYQLIPPETHPSAFPNSIGSKRNSHGQ
jgi:two-component system, NtrC family, response regulator AtoC